MGTPYSNPYANSSNEGGNSDDPLGGLGTPATGVQNQNKGAPPISLTAEANNAAIMAVPASQSDPVSPTGWLSWDVFREYLEDDLGVPSVGTRTREHGCK